MKKDIDKLIAKDLKLHLKWTYDEYKRLKLTGDQYDWVEDELKYLKGLMRAMVTMHNYYSIEKLPKRYRKV